MNSSTDTIHAALSKKLTTTKYIKASDVNTLFYTCQSLEQLEKAKEILARYSTSISGVLY